MVSYVMNSRTIATELERRYPSPPLHLDSPMLLRKVEERDTKVVLANGRHPHD